MNHEEKAKKLFVEKLNNYKLQDIKEFKKLSGGFTNFCYYIKTLNGKEFFVRIGSHKIDRTNEYSYLCASKKIKKYLYYDFSSGDAIKKWEKGRDLTFEECLIQKNFIGIVKEIKKIQKIKLHKVLKIKVRNFYQFFTITKIDKKYLNKYKQIIEKYKNLDLVVSHNDIRPSNILINKNKINIIDFEWCTLNNKYWDFANIVRELDYPLNEVEIIFKKYFKNLDFDIFKEILFAATCFGVQWSFSVKESKDLIKYRNSVIKILEKYYKLFFES
ncbi:MAG: phosphotransferase [Malacoplasma sp.]|nr:phosphotransferase [Malacoplasma sp.]